MAGDGTILTAVFPGGEAPWHRSHAQIVLQGQFSREDGTIETTITGQN